MTNWNEQTFIAAQDLAAQISDYGLNVVLYTAGGAAVAADAHARIHRGEMFCASIIISLATDTNFDIAVTSGTLMTHITPVPTLGGTFDFYVYHTPTFTGGQAMTAYNQKIGSPKTLDATIVHSPTVTNVGTGPIKSFELPGGSGGQAFGGIADFNEENYIPAGGKLLIRMTNISGQTRTGSIMLFAYNTAAIPDA